MKKTLIIAAAIMAAALSTYAQGTVVFANGNSGLVTYTTDTSMLRPADAALAGTKANSTFSAALYWASNGAITVGAASDGVMVQLGAITQIQWSPNAVFAGKYSGGERQAGAATPGGAPAVFQVKVWETAYGATYEAALASAPGTAYFGSSAFFLSPTTGNPAAQIPATSLQNFALPIDRKSVV